MRIKYSWICSSLLSENKSKRDTCSDGSRSKNFDPGWVKFWLLRSAIFVLGLVLENFPLKSQIFQFFALRVKKNLIESGQELPGSKQGRFLIYCGLKYAWVGSGQGPSLDTCHS